MSTNSSLSSLSTRSYPSRAAHYVYPPLELNDPVTVERRVAAGPLEGVVAYLGPVQFGSTSGNNDWVGVRLTGPSVGLGKNDGSVNGVRYFDGCDTDGGVFVRRNHVSKRSLSKLEELRLKRELRGLAAKAANETGVGGPSPSPARKPPPAAACKPSPGRRTNPSSVASPGGGTPSSLQKAAAAAAARRRACTPANTPSKSLPGSPAPRTPGRTPGKTSTRTPVKTPARRESGASSAKSARTPMETPLPTSIDTRRSSLQSSAHSGTNRTSPQSVPSAASSSARSRLDELRERRKRREEHAAAAASSVAASSPPSDGGGNNNSSPKSIDDELDELLGGDDGDHRRPPMQQQPSLSNEFESPLTTPGASFAAADEDAKAPPPPRVIATSSSPAADNSAVKSAAAAQAAVLTEEVSILQIKIRQLDEENASLQRCLSEKQTEVEVFRAAAEEADGRAENAARDASRLGEEMETLLKEQQRTQQQEEATGDELGLGGLAGQMSADSLDQVLDGPSWSEQQQNGVETEEEVLLLREEIETLKSARDNLERRLTDALDEVETLRDDPLDWRHRGQSSATTPVASGRKQQVVGGKERALARGSQSKMNESKGGDLILDTSRPAAATVAQFQITDSRSSVPKARIASSVPHGMEVHVTPDEWRDFAADVNDKIAEWGSAVADRPGFLCRILPWLCVVSSAPFFAFADYVSASEIVAVALIAFVCACRGDTLERSAREDVKALLDGHSEAKPNLNFELKRRRSRGDGKSCLSEYYYFVEVAVVNKGSEGCPASPPVSLEETAASTTRFCEADLESGISLEEPLLSASD